MKTLPTFQTHSGGARLAILLGLLGIAAAFAFANSAYRASRDAVAETIYRSNLAMARALISSTASSNRPVDQAVMAIDDGWHQTYKPFSNSFLCVMDSEARLLKHTLRPDTVGEFVGDMPISAAAPDGPSNLVQLLERKADWSGRNLNLAGFEQLVAFAYAPEFNGLIAVHVPAAAVDAEIHTAESPWFFAMLSMGGLVPISLALLFLSASRERRKLVASEARFHDLYLEAPIMYCSVDITTGNICECNEIFLRNFGFSMGEIIGRPVFELYHPGSREKSRATMAEFMRTGHVEDVELRMLTKSGEARDVLLNSTAVRDSSGRVIRSRSVLQDITDSKRAEAAFQRSEEQLQLVTDNAPAMLVHCDSQSRYIFVNQPYATMFGLHPADIVGRHVRDVIGEEAYAHTAPHIAEALAGQTVEFELALPMVRPELPTVEVRYAPQRDTETGDIVGFVGAIVDITERRAAEVALRDSEALNRRLIENSRDVIWETQFEGLPEIWDEVASGRQSVKELCAGENPRVRFRLTFVSPAIDQLTGYTVEESLAQPIEERFTPATLVKMQEEFCELLERLLHHHGQPPDVVVMEFEEVHKNGSVIATEVCHQVLMDEKGRPTGVMGVTRNITERKQAEEALERIHEGTAGTIGGEFFDSLVHHLAGMLRVQYAFIGQLLPGEPQRVRMLAVFAGQKTGCFEFHLVGSPCEKVMEDSYCFVPDRAAERFPNDRRLGEMGIQSYCGVVLRNASGQETGVLAVMDEHPMVESVSIRPLLEIFASRAGAEIERMELEQTRKNSEKRLRHILDSMFTFVGLYSLDGTLIETNAAPLKAANLQRKDVIGKPFWDTYWWSYSTAVQEQLRDALKRAADGETVRYDVSVRVAENQFIVIDVTFGPIYDETGAVVELVGSAVDITERKQAEEHLRESDAMLRSFFDSGGTLRGIVELREDDILHVADNEVTAAFFGRTVESMRGQRASEMGVPSEIIRMWHGHYREAERLGRPVIFTYEHTGEDGLPVLQASVSHLGVVVDGNPRFGYVVNDITEQKRAEEELQLSEHRLRLATDSAKMGVWDYDVINNRLVWDERMYALYGLQKDDFSGVVEAWEKAVHPEDFARASREVQEALAGQRDFDTHFRVVWPDGQIRFIEAHALVLRGTDGVAQRMIGMNRDITRRIDAEKSLRANEERFRMLFDNAPEAAVLVDTETHRFVQVNPVAEELFKLPAERICQCRPLELSPECQPNGRLSSEMETEFIERTLRDGFCDFDWLHFDSEGTEIPCEIRLLRVEMDGRIVLRGSLTDVRERREAEAERSRLLNVLERSLNEIYLFNAETLRFEYVNDGALRNLGYDLDAMREMTPLSIKPEYTPEKFAGLIAPLRAREQEIVRFETIHQRADGSSYPVEVHLQLIRQPDGDVFLAVILDITERKQVEERLRMAFDQQFQFMAILSPEGRVIEINALLEKQWPDSTGRYFWEAPVWQNLPEWPAKVRSNILRVAEMDEPLLCEDQIMSASGEVRYLDAAYQAMRGPDGEVKYFLLQATDVTERKQAEQEIDRSRQFLDSLINASPIIVFVKDLEGRHLMINDQYEKAVGKTREQVLGRTDDEIFPPEAARKIREQDRAIIKDAEACQFQERVPMPDGPHDYLTNKVPLQNPDGEIFALCGWALDITERTKTEEALRESEALYQSLVENLPQCVYLKDLKGRFTYVNDRFCDLTRRDRNSILGRTDTDLFPEALAKKYARDDRLVLGERTIVHTEEEHRSGVGEIQVVEVVKFPVLDTNGKIVGSQGIFWDITERIEAQKRINDLSRAIDQTPDAVFMTDRAGRFTFVNPAFEALTGYRFGELDGQTPRIIKSDQVPSSFYDELWHTILEGQAFRATVINRKKNGKLFYCDETITPLADDAGQITGFVAAFKDITEQRQAEASLKRLSNRLLQVQDAERRRLARELHDSTAQTLAALTMNLSVLRDAEEVMTPEVEPLITDSQALAEQSAKEIRTLAYLLHPPVLDELGLPQAIQDLAKGFADRSQIAVELDLPEKWQRLSNETELTLFRIVQESLANLRRHSGSETATICLKSTETGVLLEVSDAGKGFQRPASGSERTTGVGIAGMRERLDQLGGSLEIESSPKGSTIRARIPLDP